MSLSPAPPHPHHRAGSCSWLDCSIETALPHRIGDTWFYSNFSEHAVHREWEKGREKKGAMWPGAFWGLRATRLCPRGRGAQAADHEQGEADLAKQVASFNRRCYQRDKNASVLAQILAASTLDELLQYGPCAYRCAPHRRRCAALRWLAGAPGRVPLQDDADPSLGYYLE